MLYKVVLFLKSGKQLTLLQHSIIRSTQIDTLTDRTHRQFSKQQCYQYYITLQQIHYSTRTVYFYKVVKGGSGLHLYFRNLIQFRVVLQHDPFFHLQCYQANLPYTCTPRRFLSLRNSYTPLFIAHTLILIRHYLTVHKQTIRVHQYSTNTLYGTIQIYCSVQWQICTFITFVAAPGGRSEEFRKDNALIKIQKQINKSTVQALGGNCPPREDIVPKNSF